MFKIIKKKNSLSLAKYCQVLSYIWKRSPRSSRKFYIALISGPKCWQPRWGWWGFVCLSVKKSTQQWTLHGPMQGWWMNEPTVQIVTCQETIIPTGQMSSMGSVCRWDPVDWPKPACHMQLYTGPTCPDPVIDWPHTLAQLHASTI